MKMRMKDVLGVGWSGPEMEEMVEICGVVGPRGHVCDEPYWMGPHTWHHANATGGWQWCSCGRDHHYAEECEAVTALRQAPEWKAFVEG